MQPPIPISGPLGLGDLLDGTFRLLRARFSKLALTAAIFLVPVGVLAILIFGVAANGFVALFTVAAEEPFSSGASTEFGVLGTIFLVTLVGYLGTALAYVSLTSHVFAYLAGEDIAVGEGIRRGVRRLLPYIGAVLLYGLVLGVVALVFLFALMILVVFLTAIVGIVFSTVTNNILINIGILFITLFFTFVAGVAVMAPVGFLSASWIVGPTVAVGEARGPVSALARSWALTKRNRWRCFGYLVLLTVLNYVILGLPVTVLQWLAVIILPPQIMGLISGVIIGLNYFFNILWYPFLVLALVLLYFDLRVRNESYDLDLRIRQLEESLPPANLP